MTEPRPEELPEVIAFAAAEAERYLEGIDDRPVRDPYADDVALRFRGPLPEEGVGSLNALAELVDGFDGSVRSAGARFFHFVNGGTTPAALGADWFATALDQNVGAWVSTPLGAQIERVALGWLKELFGLPASMGGVLTTGATMANFTALACARRWAALELDVDPEEEGLAFLPPIPVFASGYLHPSDVKALSMLGMGRKPIRRFALDGTGRVDLEALEAALRARRGKPSIVVGSAGEVNTGDFDPIAAMGELAREHGAWFHVDGAFGLFAALSPRTEHLVEGVAEADSVAADGHKWLNVPYESGFVFVKDAALLPAVFTSSAAYLEDPADPRPTWGYLGPEMSRRARALPIWATLRAYGREGYRGIVERHLDLAQHLAAQIDAAPDLERLADVPLNIVCFRYHPDGMDDEKDLDDLNGRIADAVLEDGRVFFGSTVYDGKVAFRPAPVNWRNREEHLDLVVDVTRELGAELH